MQEKPRILDALGVPLPPAEYKGLKFNSEFFERHARKRCKYYKKIVDYVEKGITMPIRDCIAIGRNEPCPCGSMMKFKYCHWGRMEEKKT
jgi:hypothetical protein